MTKKRDFIQSQQNRDKHPDSGMRGSAAEVDQRGADMMNTRTSGEDRQAPLSGKVDNDHNKLGNQAPTQKNEGRRTPQSRHDRESHVGGDNQGQARTGGKGGGRSPRGAG